jgi:hypothetical protein
MTLFKQMQDCLVTCNFGTLKNSKLVHSLEWSLSLL